MEKLTRVFNNARKTFKDLELINNLRSEIQLELLPSSTSSPKYIQSGSLGSFLLDYDSPQTRDVVLRKKFESGEEVSVAALLGPETQKEGSNYFWEIIMKICIKKPSLNSVLQFDCRAYDKGHEGSEFDICEAYYLPSTTSLDPSIYRGPPFSSLDRSLQEEFKNYLISKGIEKEFTDFIICHIHQKQQGQYLNWLLKLQEMVEQIDDPTETSEKVLHS